MYDRNTSIGVNLRVTAHSNQGGRKYMEDMFCVAYQPTSDEKDLLYAYFGIFDGHGGRDAAIYAKTHLMDHIVSQKNFWSDQDELVLKAIRDGFISVHHAMWRVVDKWPKTHSGLPSTSGTTASVGFVRRGKLYVGHVGDSGIVMGYQDPNSQYWKAKRLTVDHKPESPTEQARIVRCGGKVINKSGVPRVVWNRPRSGHKGPVRRSTLLEEIPFLAVARSLGDLWSYNSEQNDFVVSPVPDTSVFDIDVNTHRCLILGSDGLWNMLSPQDAVNSVYFAEKNNEKQVQIAIAAGEPNNPKNWLNPSKRLVDRAIDRWNANQLRPDNTSVVTVVIDPPGPPKGQDGRRQSNAANLISSIIPNSPCAQMTGHNVSPPKPHVPGSSSPKYPEDSVVLNAGPSSSSSTVVVDGMPPGSSPIIRRLVTGPAAQARLQMLANRPPMRTAMAKAIAGTSGAASQESSPEMDAARQRAQLICGASEIPSPLESPPDAVVDAQIRKLRANVQNQVRIQRANAANEGQARQQQSGATDGQASQQQSPANEGEAGQQGSSTGSDGQARQQQSTSASDGQSASEQPPNIVVGLMQRPEMDSFARQARANVLLYGRSPPRPTRVNAAAGGARPQRVIASTTPQQRPSPAMDHRVALQRQANAVSDGQSPRQQNPNLLMNMQARQQRANAVIEGQGRGQQRVNVVVAGQARQQLVNGGVDGQGRPRRVNAVINGQVRLLRRPNAVVDGQGRPRRVNPVINGQVRLLRRPNAMVDGQGHPRQGNGVIIGQVRLRPANGVIIGQIRPRPANGVIDGQVRLRRANAIVDAQVRPRRANGVINGQVRLRRANAVVDGQARQQVANIVVAGQPRQERASAVEEPARQEEANAVVEEQEARPQQANAVVDEQPRDEVVNAAVDELSANDVAPEQANNSVQADAVVPQQASDVVQQQASDVVQQQAGNVDQQQAIDVVPQQAGAVVQEQANAVVQQLANAVAHQRPKPVVTVQGRRQLAKSAVGKQTRQQRSNGSDPGTSPPQANIVIPARPARASDGNPGQSLPPQAIVVNKALTRRQQKAVAIPPIESRQESDDDEDEESGSEDETVQTPEVSSPIITNQSISQSNSTGSVAAEAKQTRSKQRFSLSYSPVEQTRKRSTRQSEPEGNSGEGSSQTKRIKMSSPLVKAVTPGVTGRTHRPVHPSKGQRGGGLPVVNKKRGTPKKSGNQEETSGPHSRVTRSGGATQGIPAQILPEAVATNAAEHSLRDSDISAGTGTGGRRPKKNSEGQITTGTRSDADVATTNLPKRSAGKFTIQRKGQRRIGSQPKIVGKKVPPGKGGRKSQDGNVKGRGGRASQTRVTRSMKK